MKPTRPTAERFQTRRPGTSTGAKTRLGGTRACSVKRIAIRRAPGTDGIEALNAAERSPTWGPVAQALRRARSGGAWASATAGRVSAMRQMTGPTRRMALEQQDNPGVVALPGQVMRYSGPSPPSGVVSRPPLAVIAPHCTQFV